MGWTFYHLDYPNKIEEVRNLYTWQEDDRGAEVLDVAANGNIVYAAVHYWNHATNEDEIHAAVVKTATVSRDYFNFGYKDMSESMNPYYYDCPKRILDLLTPTTNEYALEWRRKCAEKRERTNALNRMKEGARISCCDKTLRLVCIKKRGKTRDYWLVEKDGVITWTYWQKSRIIDNGWEVLQSEV